MRRFASVFARRKPSSSASESSTDDQNNAKKSWKKWLNTPKQQQKEERQPLVDDGDDEVDQLDTSMLLALTRDSLAAPSTSPLSPFVEPEGPMFPRSVNTPLHLPQPQSLRVRILKSSLLRHNSKSSNPPLFLPSSDLPNISRPKTPVHLASRGTDRWITRPCFEERYSVYLPSPSGIQPKHVSASLAIAALEYSEHLDVMAHPDLLAHQDRSETATPSHPALPSVPEPPRTSQKPLASPLRNEHLPPVPALPTSDVTETVAPMPPSGPVKRIVRFAQENDDDESSDDSVPLHFIRQKNQRQEKAKFLQHERLRRREEDEERKRQQKEAAEREKQRVLLEAERAQAEKERKERAQTAYAAEVVRTRIRREMHRAGGVPALVMRERENNFGVSSSASERNKPPLATTSSAASLRGVASPSANPPSDSLSHAHQLQAASDSSPSSSRPSSMLAPSPGPPYQSHSRPPSTYSSSSESGGKRNSFMAMPSSVMGTPPMAMTVPMNMSAYPVPSPMIMTYPPFATSNPNLSYMTPVVPFFPDYMASDFDMPLLPPAAPFMKQPSYERRKSSASTPGSERNPSGFASTPASTDSSRRGSFSSSSEKLVPAAPVLSGTPRKPSEPISSWGRGTLQSSSQSQRSASGPASVSSKDRSSFSHSMPAKSATMPPMPSPWTGVPTAQQMRMRMETQMQARAGAGAMSMKMPKAVTQGGGGSRTSPKSTDVLDGGSTTGGSSSTSTRRGSSVVNNRASYSAWSQRQVAIS